MNVCPMVLKIFNITNAMIGEPPLPHFSATKLQAKGVRVSTFNELNRSFEGDVLCWSEQQVDMLWHDHESMQQELALPPVTVERFQEQPDIRLNDKQSLPLPSGASNEIGSGRGDTTHGLHSLRVARRW